MDVRHVIAKAPMSTVRPRDLEGFYAAPRPQVQRLTERGVIHRLADGYYCLVPLGSDPETWRPAREVAAAAIGAALWGSGQCVVMGKSAARIHGAIPRAMARAWIAAPAQHALITLAADGAVVEFVRRDTAALDAEATSSELGHFLVTTPAQTALDLARDPKVLDDAEARAAIDLLLRIEPIERAAERDGPAQRCAGWGRSRESEEAPSWHPRRGTLRSGTAAGFGRDTRSLSCRRARCRPGGLRSEAGAG